MISIDCAAYYRKPVLLCSESYHFLGGRTRTRGVRAENRAQNIHQCPDSHPGHYCRVENTITLADCHHPSGLFYRFQSSSHSFLPQDPEVKSLCFWENLNERVQKSSAVQTACLWQWLIVFLLWIQEGHRGSCVKFRSSSEKLVKKFHINRVFFCLSFTRYNLKGKARISR